MPPLDVARRDRQEVDRLDLHVTCKGLPVAAPTGTNLRRIDAARSPAAAGVAAAGALRRLLLLALRRELLQSGLHRRGLASRLRRDLALALRLSQRSPPSGAGSGGSSRRRTRAATPS